MVTVVVPSPPRFLPSIFIAHRVQQSHWSSIFHRVLLTHAPALSASQFVHKKKSPRICTSTHSGEFELTKLTYTRLEDNLIRHRGHRYTALYGGGALNSTALTLYQDCCVHARSQGQIHTRTAGRISWYYSIYARSSGSSCIYTRTASHIPWYTIIGFARSRGSSCTRKKKGNPKG